MRPVYTYSDLNSLKNAPYYEELRNSIHIGSSLKLNSKMETEGYFSKNLSFNKVHRNIDYQWDSDETRIYNMTMISEYLRNLIVASKDEDERIWLEGCFKEIFSIWSSIGLMEEADLKPDMIADSDRNIRLMCDVWRHLIENGHTIPKYRSSMRMENAVQKISEAIESEYDENRVIVIHGFYYFTPIQERIMLAMEEAGYKLRFLIPYDDKYPYANEIWTLLYNSENGYSDKENWIDASSDSSNCFGAVFENEGLTDCSVRLVEYGSIVEMIDDFEKITPDCCTVYSADSTGANEILRNFFPDEYGTRTFLSYPIGQFIFTLHRMWNPETQCILIESEHVSECFASGWASYEDLNSKDYFYDLQKILPFFENCTTVHEWNRRLRLLHSIDKDVVSVFRSKNEDATVKRWENVLNNPFSNFSMFDVESDRLDSVITLITELINSARELFGSEDGCKLNEHFTKLNGLLQERGGNSKELQTELENVNAILVKMMGLDSEDTFRNEDISQTVTYFLAGDYTKAGQEEKTLEDWVKPLTEIDGNITDNVHICLSELKALPGGPRDIVWPLTKSCIRNLRTELTGEKQDRLLWHMMFILDELPKVNRYMMFSAFRNKHITISWISEMNQKLYAPSPYISLLSRFYGTDIERESESRFTEDVIDSIPAANPSVTKYSIAGANVISDARLEYAMCPKRYLYSYLLNENPTFKSEFLQNFAIGGFLKTLIELQKVGGFSRESIEERVFELFPGKLSIIKQNILDRSAASSGNMLTTRYENREYTDLRYDIKFPVTVRGFVEKKLKDIDFNVEYDLTIGDGERERCMYCPHSEYCSETKYENTE